MRLSVPVAVLLAALVPACGSPALPGLDGGSLLDAGTDPDSGVALDAEVALDAAIALDAEVARDAALALDAGVCDPAAVRFPMGGTLSEGTLCDDVFVCAADAAQAAAVQAASPRFRCDVAPEGPCAGVTCAFRDPGGPSTLDPAEIAEICKITVLVPRPDLVCFVYL